MSPIIIATADHIRSRLVALVEADGRAPADIAQAADMSRQQFWQILTGFRANPSIVTIARVLAALGKRWRDLD